MEKQWNEALVAILQAKGADDWGFADLTACQPELEEAYGAVWRDYPRAISLAVFLPWAVVEQLLDAPTHTYLYYYDVVNQRINDICLSLTQFLESQGYRAFPIPASQRVEDRLDGIFSHRLAARLAGLGWIGKCCSLIHPQVGPRLRLGTVLTDMPLQTSAPLANGCGDCQVCQNICPAGAIQGQAWRPGQPLAERLDVFACDRQLQEARYSFGKRICGLCIAACPYGRQRRTSPHAAEL